MLQRCHNRKVARQIFSLRRQGSPGAILRIEGLEYFAKAASLHTDVFQSHYNGDLIALQQSLLIADAPKEPASYGLRLAIVTQLGSDAVELRNALIENMILLSFADKNWHDIGSLCELISSELKLNRAVDESFISLQLMQLMTRNLILKDGPKFTLTQLGSAAVDQLIDTGRNQILNQKTSFVDEFRSKLPSLLDQKLDLDLLWSRLTGSLCRLLMDSGMRVVRGILGSSESLTERQNTQALLRELAINALPFGVPPKRCMEVANAVFSMLTQKTLFREWLAGVAATFVSLCSLGLHPAAQKEMLARMENWVVMVDTHLVISFICESEHDHDSVRNVLAAWARLNRRIATCDAVLEEVAYHAFAASSDFDRLWNAGEVEEANRNPGSISNAFIRAFLQKSQGNLGHTRWRRFIFNYKAADKFDGSKIRSVLTSRSWEVFDTGHIGDEELETLTRYHPQSANWPSAGIENDGNSDSSMRKAWDVRLVHACIGEASKLSSHGGSVMVMSRSNAISEMVKKSGAETNGVAIVSVSSLGYAMALTPGLSVSLPDIQELLIEEGLLKRAAIGLEKAARKVADREIEEGIDLVETPMLEEEFRNAVSAAVKRIHV